MKLMMFRAGGERKLGALRPGSEDEVVELSGLPDMRALIDAGEDGLSRARATLTSSRAKSHRLADIELLPPLHPPRCNQLPTGRNNPKHAGEGAQLDGREPTP